FSGWSICSCQKRGDGIGKTKAGKGTKVMMVSDGNGVPIGLYLDSAGHHEIRLAEATLKTVRVPQRRGRPRTRPKELVADKAYEDRKSTRLNSSHVKISYAVFCLKKKTQQTAG